MGQTTQVAQDQVFTGIARDPPHPQANLLAQTVLEVGSLVSLLLFYLMMDMLFGASSHQLLNCGGPLALVVILGFANWSMVRRDVKALWTALFWFRLSTAVYFGLGSMLVYIVNEPSRIYMESFYRFTDEEVFKFNLMVTLSVICVLIMARFSIRATSGWATRMHQKVVATKNADGRALLSAAIVSLGLGLAIRYAFITPYLLGWANFTLPGAVMSLKSLVPVGFFLLVLWGRRYAGWTLPIIFMLVSADLLFSLLSFAKSEFLLLLIMVSLANLYDRVSIKKLLVAGTIILVAYFTIKPVVSYARHEIGLSHGANILAGTGERWEILSGYVKDRAATHKASEIQFGLTRFSYVNAGTFLIHRYDSGYPDDWPNLMAAIFVPRILWPEKPVITAIGVRINSLGTGSETSSSGAGLFAEAYWAWGWWGVIFLMSLYGAVIGVLTRFGSEIVRNGQWFYFPVVLMMLQYGMRTDGHYISDAAGGLVIIVAFYVLFHVVYKIVLLKLSSRHFGVYNYRQSRIQNGPPGLR